MTSTFDEARALRRFAEGRTVTRVIVVTSAHHTRRARWVLRRQLEDLPIELLMAPAEEHGFHQSNWWKNEYGLIAIFNEYVKLVYYFFTYR